MAIIATVVTIVTIFVFGYESTGLDAPPSPSTKTLNKECFIMGLSL